MGYRKTHHVFVKAGKAGDAFANVGFSREARSEGKSERREMMLDARFKTKACKISDLPLSRLLTGAKFLR